VILVIGAVGSEAAAVRAALTDVRGTAMGRGRRLWSGRLAHQAILLLQSGIGLDQAQASLSLALERYPITGIVNVGFGGAAAPGLDAGELIVCAACHLDGPPAPVLPAHPAWLRLAQAAPGGKVSVGGCVSASRLAASPAEKRRLGARYPALVIDMEGYALAGCAARRGLPFLAVKAISDTLDERLPPFDEWLPPEGGLRWQRAAAYWAARPQDVGLLVRLYHNTRRACARLTDWTRQGLPCLFDA